MSVEILAVSLSDDSLEKLAQRVAQLIGQPATGLRPEPDQPPQEAAQAPQDDPWAGTNAQAAPQTQTQQQPAQAQPGPQVPNCLHGPMRYIPGGFSRNSNKPYAPFYGCPTPRGTPNQCKSQPA